MSAKPQRKSQPAEGDRRGERRRQLVGIFAGGGVGLMLAALFPALGSRFSLAGLVLWCAAIGGSLASLEMFIRAGAVITRSEQRGLNLLIGLGLPGALLLLFWLLFR